MSFNLRYWEERDGANAWPFRRDSVAQLILDNNPLLIGTQEGLRSMLGDLDQRLPNYSRIGEGRAHDGGNEFCAIYYQHHRLQVVRSEQFWLSEKPHLKGSKSWNSSLPRICTWAVFQDKQTKKQFAFFNTHLDHESEWARLEGSRLILEVMESVRLTYPCILTGDFNCTPDREPIKLLSNRLVNISATQDMGEVGTFHNFTGTAVNGPIDYIFCTDDVMIESGQVLNQKVNNRYPSDHFPVFARVRI